MINHRMASRDWALLLALAVIWGAAFILIGVVVREVKLLTYVWLRLAIAAVALAAWLRLSGRRALPPVAAAGPMVLLALSNNLLPFVLIGWGEVRIAGGLAAVLNATTPIFGVILAHYMTSDERLTGRRIAGVLLGFAGVAVMLFPQLRSPGGDLAAELACLVAAASYAIAGVYARRFRAMGIAPETVASGQLTAGALVLLPVMLLVDRPWTETLPSMTAWGGIVALGLLCSALAYVLYFRLIARAGATNALLVTLLTPPVAILLGGLFLGERLGLFEIGGLGFIALGLAAIDGRLLDRFAPTSPRPEEPAFSDCASRSRP